LDGIVYTDALDGITADRLTGFFVGWPNPPQPEIHLKLLQNSAHRLLAVEDKSGQVVGYVTALSDGVLFAFISSVEVLPAYQRHGIGGELVHRMLSRLNGIYAVDLVCDPDVQPFYAKCGMRPASAMICRNYARQSGAVGPKITND